MLARLSAWIFRILGWKVVVNFPDELKKYIITAVPHTSAWDLPLGIMSRIALKKDIRFVGKHTLFRPPYGWIMKALGGVPVNREKSGNFVKAVVEEFNKREEFAICVAAEGTRKPVKKLKTGFYFIAKNSGAAIILTKLDYKNKVLDFGTPFYPTDDQEADFKYIDNYFKGVIGKVPNNSYI